MKKTLPVVLGMIVGCYIVAEYFIPHHRVREVSSHVLEWGGIVAAAAYVIGAVNLVQVTWPKIRRREFDWEYKVVLLASATVMAVVGLPWRAVTGVDAPGTISRATGGTTEGKATIVIDAPDDVVITVGAGVTTAKSIDVGPGTITLKATRRVVGYDAFAATIPVSAGEIIHFTADPQMRWGADGRFRTWIYDHVFAPCNATMFALLAFFVASAAFRAFRARNVESALLLGSAIIILLARAPIGRAISSTLPDVAQWILDIPSNGSRRAIIMGAAVGAIATGLRVILGIERSHLGGDS